ncbi:binding-protein-dependent transport systems inner membrane component [Chthoniobacter flavus Ellin428]|uniref:Binding-protein-dependent transport systems inner membrane component n=1 Tax=Chthoniobacter flavus Ellin428 TaxID=497964 RepID=B4D9T7_9BACT|nr:ABC transporter permease subunit [Chthoniobacter flavus]EDY16868.1 binding-protein-dependent transport systems inner membrane component [Chthoniobacter flavus Ellin428]TCO93310.1 NitT/TauT family transport system permease protein [Chthoniobacter flavus]
MNALPEINEIRPPLVAAEAPSPAASAAQRAHARPWSWKALLIPVATAVAAVLHWQLSKQQNPLATKVYFQFLGIVGGASVLIALLQPFWNALRKWVNNMGPIIAAALLLLSVAEIITAGLHLLPLPYFPSPASVLFELISDYDVLFDCTWHSLLLLTEGYLLGVLIGVVTGVCIGWFPGARYWGMPILKVVGPIPVTALIPLSMVVAPSTTISAISLVALAVWFPVTMLTASGISNTRASYLDVARTLGASRSYLIFRVAIPAAMPNIFIGLFMGLGTSFLTLVVAETVGVKSGLGWYVGWAQGWAEYGKVYAALIIMAAFFSTVMTVLFKARDRVLVWQKGAIKW